MLGIHHLSRTEKDIILEGLTLQPGKKTIENRDHKIKTKLHNSLGGSVCAKSLQSCPTLCDPTDSSPLAILSMRFSRQECWSGLSFPSPETILYNTIMFDT